jgi:hypothetical protein
VSSSPRRTSANQHPDICRSRHHAFSWAIQRFVYSPIAAKVASHYERAGTHAWTVRESEEYIGHIAMVDGPTEPMETTWVGQSGALSSKHVTAFQSSLQISAFPRRCTPFIRIRASSVHWYWIDSSVNADITGSLTSSAIGLVATSLTPGEFPPLKTTTYSRRLHNQISFIWGDEGFRVPFQSIQILLDRPAA